MDIFIGFLLFCVSALLFCKGHESEGIAGIRSIIGTVAFVVYAFILPDWVKRFVLIFLSVALFVTIYLIVRYEDHHPLSQGAGSEAGAFLFVIAMTLMWTATLMSVSVNKS